MSNTSQPMADFKLIKKHTTVQEAYEAISDTKLNHVNNFSMRGTCPLPSHPPESSDNSFSVNTQKQVWICHNKTCQKNRGGKKGGDVIELVAQHQNITLREAGLRLAKNIPENAEKLPSKPRKEKTEVELPFESENVSTEQIDKKADVLDLTKDWLQDRLTYPLLTQAEKAVYFTVLMRIDEFEDEV